MQTITNTPQPKAANLRRKCGDLLKVVKDNVTPSNKVEAMATLKLSRPTLDKYIHGNVSKLDTGMALLAFLQAKVDESNRRLAEI